MSLPLVFVRYAPGSAGNFVIACLQTSRDIAHWDLEIERINQDDSLQAACRQAKLDWFRQKFTDDLAGHLKHEPHHPYKLDFFSAKHPRGDDISAQEFLACLAERGDTELLGNISQGRRSILRLAKSRVPDFGRGSTIVNIVIDADSRKWVNRCRAVKLFGKQDGKWIKKEEHPEFLRAKFSRILFDNQYEFDLSSYQFLKHHVVNDLVVELFTDQRRILEHASNLHSPDQYFLPLSCLFDADAFLEHVVNIFDMMGLSGPDQDLVMECYNHYYETNVKAFLPKNVC